MYTHQSFLNINIHKIGINLQKMFSIEKFITTRPRGLPRKERSHFWQLTQSPRVNHQEKRNVMARLSKLSSTHLLQPYTSSELLKANTLQSYLIILHLLLHITPIPKQSGAVTQLKWMLFRNYVFIWSENSWSQPSVELSSKVARLWSTSHQCVGTILSQKTFGYNFCYIKTLVKNRTAKKATIFFAPWNDKKT